jgi:hypothetical protein
MKYFNVHYTFDNKVERIQGETIEEAFKNAGMGGGIMRVVDFWEEITELPVEERYIYVNEKPVVNHEFIQQLRKFIIENPPVNCKCDKIATVVCGTRTFNYKFDYQSGTEIFFKSI